MAELAYPDINGVRYDYSSITVGISTLGSLKLVGVTEISYSHGLEPGDVPGASAEPIGRTRGTYSREASISMYEWEWKILRDALGDGFLEVVFNISVTYADVGQPTITHRIEGCKITKPERSHSAGSTDALVVTLPLHIIRVIEDGKKPLKKMRT